MPRIRALVLLLLLGCVAHALAGGVPLAEVEIAVVDHEGWTGTMRGWRLRADGTGAIIVSSPSAGAQPDTTRLRYSPQDFINLLDAFCRERFLELPASLDTCPAPWLSGDGSLLLMTRDAADVGGSEMALRIGADMNRIRTKPMPEIMPSWYERLHDAVVAFADSATVLPK